ncbi:MAG: DUF3683 domain-containing protein, partial [Thermodesulfobacteriota bacterium]|nr:DUF3683 domain-containing protein [Thermodesulfobacteriota bacterium]
MKKREREIPYNYTSADDDQVITHLFGHEMLSILEKLRTKRITGRSARLLFRFMGDMFIIERNPFIFQDLMDHPVKKRSFFKSIEKDLGIIEQGTKEQQVFLVIKKCRKYLADLSKRICAVSSDHKRILKILDPIVGKDNIYFDPFNLTAHATDATDWRLYPPVAVVRPSKESQVAPLVLAVKELGLNIIPRGGGTGLTGGSIPLTQTCVMINTEKLNSIKGIKQLKTESDKSFSGIELEAGVITEDAMSFAKEKKLIFATDPTSSWASTIGGNLAENAGGKTAVLFGTAIDNILSYKIVMPDGKMLTVLRKDHSLKRILPDDVLIFEVRDQNQNLVREITLTGDEIRKRGLGKDVTNKTLNGLPGIQKEGCDGIITSATFILHPEYNLKKTFCMEFFGNDMTEAGKVIAEISMAFTAPKEISDSSANPKNVNLEDTDSKNVIPEDTKQETADPKIPEDTKQEAADPKNINQGKEAALIALEHFDEEYIKAIDYKTKATGNGKLKAVLLIDMVADAREELKKGEKKLAAIMTGYDLTELTVAKDKKEAERFWRDRKKLGAIAKRTNAFKLNEDIVLPIASLADFSDYVDKYNIKEKKFNQNNLISNILFYLETAEPLEDPQWLVGKINRAREMAEQTREKLKLASRKSINDEIHADEFYRGVLELLRGFTLVTENTKKIYNKTKSQLIVIATHMHAGDGNVHVNIPVLSNDREMMKRAGVTADNIMAKAVELNGAVSGEHGIGVTKFRHLSRERVEELAKYRKRVDPFKIMNPGKLCDADVIDRIYTPSFNLLELEAGILKYTSLESLASKIANCVRCGRCKASCPVFYPKKNLFFHPRNKNLGIGALIEALLYVTQRTHSTKFKILHHLEEIADHCTICHKCHTQCPVNIDSGEISVMAREILAERKFKHTSIATSLSLNYLETRNQYTNFGMRKIILGFGGSAQRNASALLKKIPDFKSFKSKKIFQLLKSPVPATPKDTLRSIMPRCDTNQAILAEPEEEALYTVFYFPGCG